MELILKKLLEARNNKKILNTTLENATLWLKSEMLPAWAIDSISEIVDNNNWEEIDNRFFKPLEFGTAGLRGRTIGAYITKAEKGNSTDNSTQYAAVGSACLNDFNVILTTIGIFNYCKLYSEEKFDYAQRPKIVIAHDVRYFSRHFCEMVASTWTQLGGDAYIFDGPRSTPQLSFTVRYIGATAGVVITASHNPFHDNGYKVYFKDGAQVCETHANEISKNIQDLQLTSAKKFLDKDLSNVSYLSPLVDEAYMECAKEVIVCRDLFKSYKPKIVFTPLHGTGSVSFLSLAERLEIDCVCVDSQMKMDPTFTTVKFPNPEYKEALSLAIETAQNVSADAVIAMDPDADRIGVAIKNDKNEFVLIDGNKLAVLLTEYRLSALQKHKWIPKYKGGDKRNNIAIIKSLVTTPMLNSIAEHYGIKLIETLTGFKWIGAKLLDYELDLEERMRRTQGIVINYDKTTYKKRKDILLRHSTYVAIGCEESFGYLMLDKLRDKDANSTAIAFCEFLCYLKAREISFLDLLDDLYLKYGYYSEDMLSLTFEGASGMSKIERLMTSYKKNPPKRINETRVLTTTDFSNGTTKDADGKLIPPANFLVIKLINGFSVAVRASGTEPKIKMYIFGQSSVDDPDTLQSVKDNVKSKLNDIKIWLDQDAKQRLA